MTSSGWNGPTATALVLAMLAAGIPGEAAADCTCRLPGTSAPLGSIACLSPSGKTGLYRCDMNLNITSWRRIGDVCPTARTEPSEAPRQSVAFIVFAAAAGPH